MPASIVCPIALPRRSKSGAQARVGICCAWLALLALPGITRAEDAPATAPAALDSTAEAGDADVTEPSRKLVKWNEYDGPFTTARLGYGFGLDYAGYSQDDKSKQQIALESKWGVRDFRVLLRGRFKKFKREASWSIGYMYDGADEDWHFRQTGVQVAVPELSGRFFVGRTKEGYSAVKVMTGYYIWGMERSQTLDAFVPILGDGIKYMGYYPRQRIYLNLGAYWDGLSETEKFATADQLVATRLAWLPILTEDGSKLLHLGVMSRLSKPDDGFSREKSKPGVFLAPNFLDTGKFAADRSRTLGLEAYYREGPLLLATEYDWQTDHAKTGEEPTFHGGDASVVWTVTGETRKYNVPGAYFETVSPRKDVFEGGPGALEAVLTLDYNDFDDGSFQGGKFWRITPALLWHLADVLHVNVAYGYGELNRFGVKGATQFYQLRIFSFY